MQKILFSILFLFAFAFALPVQASEEESGHEESSEEFDPTEAIFEHILDAHEWHIVTIGEKHISLPLPVILWDEGQLHLFSSAKFHHGHESYNGYFIAQEGDNEGKIVRIDEAGEEFTPLDFSITKNVAALFFSIFLLLIIFIPIARKYKKRGNQSPRGFQAFIEPVIQFVIDDIAKPNIGEKRYMRYTPYLLTVFFFILINNLIGIIPFFPFGSNLTGNIAVTLTLAVFTMIIVNFSGNKGYWRHVFATPGVPIWLLPIMIPVEIIGILAKPFALMVRLFANITAGHIVVLSLVSLIFIFKSLMLSPVSIAFVIFMDVLELLVAALQAYIFTLLTALFIGMAVQEAEHH